MRAQQAWVMQIVAVLLAVVTAMFLHADAQGAGAAYTFTKIADSTRLPAGFIVVPDEVGMNSTGVVSFAARPNPSTGEIRIIKGSGDTLTTIASTVGGLYTHLRSQTAINDVGEVAYAGFGSGFGTIDIGDGTSTTIIARAYPDSPLASPYTGISGVIYDARGMPTFVDIQMYSVDGNVAINNARQTAFLGIMGSTVVGLVNGVFVAPAGLFGDEVRPVTWGGRLFPTDTPPPWYGFSSGVAMNGVGTVAFRAYDSQTNRPVIATGIPWAGAITTTTIATTGDMFSDLADFPSINDAGTVAFTGDLTTGGRGVFTGSGGPVTTIASALPDAQGHPFFSSAVINNHGDVVFQFTRCGGACFGIYIYDGENLSTDPVIERGDTLDGSTFIEVSRHAFNDAGQIAFVALVVDPATSAGSYAVFRADPILATLSISNTTITEGNTSTTPATFTVTLSEAIAKTVTVEYTTADGAATTSDNDYLAASSTLTFAPGETSKTLTVLVPLQG